MQKWNEKADLNAKLKVKDEINKKLVNLNDDAWRYIKRLEAERNTIYDIALDLDDQLAAHNRIADRVVEALLNAPSAKRMNRADADSIIRAATGKPPAHEA